MGFARSIKQIIRRGRLRRNGVLETLKLPAVSVGSGANAWVCELDNLDQDSVIYSFGAGTDISFDLDIHARTGAQVHIFDPTPRSIEWMRQQSLPGRVLFHEYGLGSEDGMIEFFPPRKSGSSHFSPVRRYSKRSFGDPVQAPVLSFGSILEQLGHESVDVVKIDIEGGEFGVLKPLLRYADRIDQLLIEFHHNYATIPESETVNAFMLLQKAGFSCFHISERTYEMSFKRTG